ncbi:casein kinase II subunit beta'-like [Drosophila obscura]|uniref:casein kinase II subunit beta'-like n=1 Tax=Drosophila obscura TaxID=7282 RepID=UPI001BB20C22|nr:casein kinase II subunit beta'-like [Drosophila obscura]
MTDSDETSWINWFCKKPGNEFFVMVDEDFIHDKFNLMFLDMEKKNYRRALQVILDLNTGSASDGVLDSEAEVQEAEELYGLIHARFIVTDRGIELMYKKYVKGVFGKCPRVFCERQHVLPIGMSDHIRSEMVRTYSTIIMDKLGYINK